MPLGGLFNKQIFRFGAGYVTISKSNVDRHLGMSPIESIYLLFRQKLSLAIYRQARNVGSIFYVCVAKRYRRNNQPRAASL